MKEAASDEATEFNTLHACLEARLSSIGSLYQRGVGEILVRHDYLGNREVGVILRKAIDEFTLVRITRECLTQVRAGWEIWFTYEQTLGDMPSLVVTSAHTRHVALGD